MPPAPKPTSETAAEAQSVASARLWRVPEGNKALPEVSGHPRLGTALGIGCLQVKHFTRCWRNNAGKFTHCPSTAEGSTSLSTAEGLQMLSRPGGTGNSVTRL